MPGFLDGSDFADLERITEDSMPYFANITRKGAFVDEGGGSGYYEPGAVIQIPCRTAPLGSSPEEQRVADQLEESGLELLIVPKDSDVRMDDSAVEVTNGKRYDVRGKVPQPTYAIHDRYVVKEVRSNDGA